MALGLASLAAGPVRAGTREEAFVLEVMDALADAARRRAGSATYVKIINRYADIGGIGLAALGPYRQRLPRSLRSRYNIAIARYMGRMAAQNAKILVDAEFRILGSRDGNVVGSLEGSRPQRVAFRLSRNAGLRVRDISMEGVWLVMQLRQIVVDRLSRTRGDFDDLITYL